MSIRPMILFVIAAAALLSLTVPPPAPSAAQSTPIDPDGCPALVQTALALTAESCADTGRNQACYGHVLLDAQPRPAVESLQFEAVGDVEALDRLGGFQLSGLDLDSGDWGVAWMQVQANLPDTLPGQNLTFVLFGDVGLSADEDTLATAALTTRAGVNVRLAPSERSTVLGSVAAGEPVMGTGRFGDWVRVRYDSGLRFSGWMIDSALEGDSAALPEVEADAPGFGPMQAFRFSSGIGRSTCAQAPDDGFVVQSPQGVGRVSFRVNGVDLEIGSTAYVRVVDGLLEVALLEGGARVMAQGGFAELLPGTLTTVRLDADGAAIGAPEFPQPYDLDRMTRLLPVLAILPRPLDAVPDPLRILRPTPTPTRAPQVNDDRGGGSDPTDPDPNDPVDPYPCGNPTLPVQVEILNLSTVDKYEIHVRDEACNKYLLDFIEPGNEIALTLFSEQRIIIHAHDPLTGATGARVATHRAPVSGFVSITIP